jgi:hypothetical protein
MNNFPITQKSWFKKLAYGLGGLAALAVVVFLTHQYLDNRLRQAVADFSQSLQPEFTLSYAQIQTAPFSGRVTLSQVALDYQQRTILRAAQIDLSAVQSGTGFLTHAQVVASKLQFSPALDAVPANADKSLVITGDSRFIFAYTPESNSFAVSDFSFDAPEQKIAATAKTLNISDLRLDSGNKILGFGLNLADASVTMPNGIGGDNSTSPYLFSLNLEFAKSAEGLGSEIRHFALNLPQRNEQISFALAKLQTSDMGRVPLGLKMQLTGLDFPVTANPETAAFWQSLGYDRIKMDADIGYEYKAEDKTILATMHFDLPDMFKSNLQLRLGGVDLAAIAQSPDASSISSAQNLQLLGGEMLFTDASLVKRVIDRNAKAANMEPAVYAQQLGPQIDQLFITDPKTANPAVIDLSGKIKTYVQNLGTMTVNFNPAQPLPISQLVVGLVLDRIKLLQLLGATVTLS